MKSSLSATFFRLTPLQNYYSPLLFIKISFSEIKGFDNFVIHKILTKLQLKNHYGVKFHLQVKPYIIEANWWQCYNFIKISRMTKLEENDTYVVKVLKYQFTEKV